MRTLNKNTQKGFTLIELMVSIFIGLIVFGGVFTTFTKQKMMYSRQEKIIKMNQNLRAALSIIKKYVKKSGISVPNCSTTDPNKKCSGLESIGSNYFVVTSDTNLDGKIKNNASTILNSLETVTFIKGTDNTLYICPNKVISNPQNNSKCQFLLDNIKTFEIKACSTDSNSGATTCTTSSASDVNKIDSIQVRILPETKDNEVTENNTKLKGSEITSRIFFINKTFQ